MLYISKRICNISLKEYAIYIPVFHMWIKKKGFIWIQSCVSSPRNASLLDYEYFFHQQMKSSIIATILHRGISITSCYIYIPVILLYIDVKVKNSGTIVSISDFYHHLFRNCFIQVRFYFYKRYTIVLFCTEYLYTIAW